MPDNVAIESVLHEERVFPPPEGFGESIGGAHVASMKQYREMYERSIQDPAAFWARIADELDWFEPWTDVLQWEAPDAKWFVGGKTNLCHNLSAEMSACATRPKKTASRIRARSAP